MEKFLKIGAVTTTHGVRGELKIYPTTDDPQRFLDLQEVILSDGRRSENHEILDVKFFKNMVILKLDGISSMDEAAGYRSWDVLIPREQGVPLGENEYYTADVIGMTVRTEDGEVLGTLQDVIETGANDVYAVQTDAYGEVLIPAIKPCIMKVNVEEGEMIVHLLPGLIGK
ncbi:MAG: ribosome maturation factor RimM [Bilifractor sp.]